LTPSRQIMIVDDDESIREFVEVFLSGEGYEVVAAPHGAAALEMIQKVIPALILLDMRMPIMDGWEFAQAYREMPEPHAPLVVLTAALDAGEESEEIEADDYVAKPFDLEELLGVVRKHVDARPQDPPAA
jgi:two-component system, chemotaxis family, chemotaxis protein CheY